MSAIVFRTSGTLDLRALTTFGITAKPNSQNPIGFFGTGLKYAIAVLARHEINVDIYTAGTHWQIQKVGQMFRNKPFDAIALYRHRKLLGVSHRDLPFTTELGKTWELWQAFRELHANTLDEGGGTYEADEETEGVAAKDKYSTYIFVGPGGNAVNVDRFVDCFNNRDEIFLPEAFKEPKPKGKIQVVPRPSEYIFYRGLRVLKLEKPALYTYNILRTLQLTEDRTVSYNSEIPDLIKEYWAEGAENRASIERVVTAPEDTYEGSLQWHNTIWTSPMPSVVFREVARSKFSHASFSSSARQFIKRHEPEDVDDTSEDWRQELIDALAESQPDWDVVMRIIQENKNDVQQVLAKAWEVPF
jgi:hypothetical protein